MWGKKVVSDRHLWINSLTFNTFYFIVFPSAIAIYWGKGADHLILPHIKLFEKGNGVFNLAPRFIFCMIFEKKKLFLTPYSINWPNFIVWLCLLLEILDNMCIAITCHPGCDVINFEIRLTLAFLSSHFPTWPKKPG